MDWDSDAVSNPRNHLKIKRWDGNMEDQSLLELGFMLRSKSCITEKFAVEELE